MPTIYSIYHNNNLYEITVSGTIVTRILCFLSSGMVNRDLDFDALPKPVIEELVRQLLEHDE